MVAVARSAPGPGAVPGLLPPTLETRLEPAALEGRLLPRHLRLRHRTLRRRPGDRPRSLQEPFRAPPFASRRGPPHAAVGSVDVSRIYVPGPSSRRGTSRRALSVEQVADAATGAKSARDTEVTWDEPLRCPAVVITLVLVELTLAFIVFCADSVDDERRRPAERLVRAVLWMVTLTRWFTHRNVAKLGRFGAVVWFLVTTGWLLTLEFDRMSAPAFLVIAQVTMGFVVYCVDALSADLQNKPGRRLLRSVFWVVPVVGLPQRTRQRRPGSRQRDGVGAADHRLAAGLLADRVAVPWGSGMRLCDAFRERRPFPGQDPWVVAHDGSFLLVQSAGGNRRIVVKRFRDLERMDRNVETVIWAPTGPQQPAPAGVGAGAAPSRRPLVPLLRGRRRPARPTTACTPLVADDPLGPYRELGPVCDPGHDVWAIDLTVFGHEGRLYALWSGWEGPDDGFPQNLYIAPMAEPVDDQRRAPVPVAARSTAGRRAWPRSTRGPRWSATPSSGRLFILYAADASWTRHTRRGCWSGRGATSPTRRRGGSRPTPCSPAAATAASSTRRRDHTSSTTES